MMSITVFCIKDLQNRIQLRKEALELSYRKDYIKKYGLNPDWFFDGDWASDEELYELYFKLEKMMPEICTQAKSENKNYPINID